MYTTQINVKREFLFVNPPQSLRTAPPLRKGEPREVRFCAERPFPLSGRQVLPCLPLSGKGKVAQSAEWGL